MTMDSSFVSVLVRESDVNTSETVLIGPVTVASSNDPVMYALL